MKRRVEAGHLLEIGMAPTNRLNEFDLAGQVVRIVGPEPVQLGQELLGDDLRLGVAHPMDHAVSHGRDRRQGAPLG